ncbi:hypothetical protein UNDYM_2984 [Undibacterium sp. YM2]|nr:hypothetical protein UNDYM_2984 [Undibacterium sp. YM2]
MHNHLLAALPVAEFASLSGGLELISMAVGDVLYEAGVRQQFVYFPTSAIVSLLYVLEDGVSAEIAAVGHEGVVGISLFMGGTRRLTVQLYKALVLPIGSRGSC